MANSMEVLECPHCGRRSESQLANDVPHSFDVDCYVCEHCGKIIRVPSAKSGWLALGIVAAAALATAISRNNE